MKIIKASVSLAATMCIVFLATGCAEVSSTDSSFCVDTLYEASLAESASEIATTIKQIANTTEIQDGLPPMHGGSAGARIGDWLIQNERVRAVVQAPGYMPFVGSYGGNLIDVDVRRSDGQWHDNMGEITSLIGLGYTIDGQQIEIISDGSNGTAVLRVQGPLNTFEFINLPFAIAALPEILADDPPQIELQIPWDPLAPTAITAAQYYELRHDENFIRYRTVLCNPTEKTIFTDFVDIIDSGGNVSYFNTATSKNGVPGFGAAKEVFDILAPAGDIGFVGTDSSYALAFDQEAGMIVFAGLGVVVHGTDNPVQHVLDALTGFSPRALPGGYIALAPGGQTSITRQIHIGADYNDLTHSINESRGFEESTTLSGRVESDAGALQAATVVAYSQTGIQKTVETVNGEFSIQVSDAEVKLVAVTNHVAGTAVTVSSGAQNIRLIAPPSQMAPAGGSLSVMVTEVSKIEFGPPLATTAYVDGHPIPAKISVQSIPCVPQTALLTDTRYESFGDDVCRRYFVDADGAIRQLGKRSGYRAPKQSLWLPKGTHTITISRGLEYDTFVTSITIIGGETLRLDVPLYHVIDTGQWVSIDTHVHTVNSPDAPVPLADRVLSFAAAGVDVLVATDHDFITDLSPIISELGMEEYVFSMVGEEMTMFDFGHFNAFPLAHHPELPLGGAVDPHGGRGPTSHPDKFLATLRAAGDDPESTVVQINHPRSALFGYFSAIGLNTATLKTTRDSSLFRMDPLDPLLDNDNEEDSRLYSADYDAFELYNIYAEITPGLNDYFALLNLGVIRTALAASDTHDWYSSEPGMPRSFVKYTGDDLVKNLDSSAIAKAILDAEVTGTNGPFLEVSLAESGGIAAPKSAGPGQILSSDQDLTLTITTTMPNWVTIDTIEIFSNTPDVATKGRPQSEWPKALVTHRLTNANWMQGQWSRQARIEVDVDPENDAWFVVVAHDAKDFGADYAMTPVYSHSNELAFAYSNALFVDRNNNDSFDPPGVVGDVTDGGKSSVSLAPVDTPATEPQMRDMVYRALGAHTH